MKRTQRLLIAGIACAVAAAGILVGCVLLLNRPLKAGKAAFLYIDDNDNLDSVYVKMESQLHIAPPAGLRLLASCGKYGKNIHPGAYRFRPTDTVWDMFHRLQTGNQTPVRLTVPSVRTIGQLTKTLSRQLMADSAGIASLLHDSVYCARLGYNACTLPALFIPDTYEVYWNIAPEKLIERLKKEHDHFWNPTRREKADSMGLKPEEVATLASIVEEETANKAEKPLVAGLYLNRLHIGMPLQADPTVKFALGAFALRRILHKHLETDSPYNTYKYPGLPPGPIRIPSIEGIESVLNYARHDYLYMCAKEDFSGTHNFARSWNEHLANARRYQLALNRKGIR